MKTRLLLGCLLFSLPALACSLFQTQDLGATATFVAGEIFATWTAEAPTVTPTPTITVTPTPTDTPLPTDTPEPTVTSESHFGPITFSEGDYVGRPVNPATKFQPGIETVWACWDYWGMNPDLRFTHSWYNNGKERVSKSISWDRAENGSFCTNIYWVEGSIGLPTGNWELKLYIDNELVQSGTFTIGD